MAQIALLVVSVLSLPWFGVCMSPDPVVVTTNGTVIGVYDAASGVAKFLGIPYAEPPVGPYRLRQAVPLEKSFDNFQADEFGHSCYSSRVQGNDSEDGLTLNVWRPAALDANNESLPVLVWLYGGGLTSGYTREEIDFEILVPGLSALSIVKEKAIFPPCRHRQYWYPYKSNNQLIPPKPRTAVSQQKLEKVTLSSL